jgi:hypothetical protein
MYFNSRQKGKVRGITGFVTRLTRWVPLVEQELLTLSEHLSSPPVFSWVRVTRFLVLYVCFVDRCLYFFCWPLCFLFFFDIRILIAPLVSSNSSYLHLEKDHVLQIQNTISDVKKRMGNIGFKVVQ